MLAGVQALTVRQALTQSGLVPVDAAVLLGHVLEHNRAWLIAHDDDVLEPAACAAFFALAKRRRDGEPAAYLVGRREFYGLDLRLTDAVLIPRPETETLVEMALARMEAGVGVRVLDLGTGSGAIALALAHERPHAQVWAVDRSVDALDVARANARRLSLARVRFVHSDWYAAVAGEVFDVIVSNPPYVAASDAHLDEGDLRFEPRGALTCGVDGLDALRVIIAGAAGHLAPGGHLLVEHGFDQAPAVQGLLRDASFDAIESRRDLAGIPRIAAARKR